MTHLLRPDRAELYYEVKDTFDRYIRELRADRSWEAGAYRDDPAHARRPTSFLVWEPEVYTGTESYADNRDVLDTIERRVEAELPRALCTIIVGDQQTFDRMMKLKRSQYEDYKHVIPFNGEMHMCAHFCHAGWRLWWPSMLEPFLELYNPNQKVLKEDWTVKHWSHYDDFMFYFTTGSLRWLSHHVLHNLLDVDSLLEYTSSNRTTQIFLHFLLDVCIPYVELRQIIRQTSSAENRDRLQLYYAMLMHLCRTDRANKFLYAMLCVHSVWLHNNVIPSVRAIWDAMSTVSWSGYPGRNIAIDHLIEKVNRGAKSILHGNITWERIKILIPTLNVLLPCERAYFSMMGGIEDDTEDPHSHKQSQHECASRVETCLDTFLGGSWDAMRAPDDDNNFRQGYPGTDPADPQDLIARKQVDYAAYARRMQADIRWHEHIV